MASRNSFTALAYPKLQPFWPILRRSPDELQLGLGGGDSLVIAGVSSRYQRLFPLFDGRHSLASIRSAARRFQLDPTVVDWLLTQLHAAELLIEGGRDAEETEPTTGDDSLAQFSVRLVGTGQLGQAIAAAMVQSGLGALFIVDNERRAPRLPRNDSSPTVVSVINHWSKPVGIRPELTIIASDCAEPDRAIAAGLLSIDQPQLIVRPMGGGAVIGPLVVPGRAACLNCTDLTRRDADPAWPELLAQLCRTPLGVLPMVAQWAGVQAATQALAFCQGGQPETVGATLELLPPDYLGQVRPWPAHPECGCTWGVSSLASVGTAQWTP